MAEIDRAIGPDGEVRDDATPALKAIRRDIRGARASLRERAERMVGELGNDAHATVMGSRHVLVVPRGKVKRGGGLVHGASHTGGSLYFEPMHLLDLNNELETRIGDEMEEVDRILQKVHERGMQSLTYIERQTLERASRLRQQSEGDVEGHT